MSAAQYIGRIGGLAVTLGLGAALTTGTGIAWAGPSEAAGSQQATTTHDRKAERSSALTGAAKRIRAARDDADSKEADSPKPRGVNQGAAFTRAQEISKAAKDFGAAVDRAVDGVTEKITDRLNDAAKGTVLIRTPDAEPADGQQSAEPEVVIPSPAPEEVRTAQSVPRPDGSSGPSTIRAVPADRLPSLHTSNADIQTAVQAAVDGIARRASSATETIAAHPATFVGSAITDIRAAISPTTTSFTMKAIEPAVEAPKTPQLVSSVLAAVGLAPLVGNSPLAPTPPPALWALLAWARREFEKTINPAGTTVQTMALVEPTAALVVDPNLQTPKPAAPVVGETTALPWVTYPGITTAPYGTPGNYGIAGTDLGIMWDDGAGNILMIFGDTFDQTGMQGVWRSNVLLRTIDTDLSDGIQIQDAVISPDGDYNQNTWSSNYGATQVIRDPGFLGLFGSTTTIIPTAAISVTDDNGKTTQYVNVMSVRTWDTPGRWTTNWSAIAYSEDGGKTWTVDPNTVRSSGWLRSSTPYVPGNQNFQQGAFVMGQEGDVNAEGVRYVYSFGTPSGRGGSAYVSRVPEDEIRNLSAYEYWGGDDRGWVANDPSAAVPVIGATDSTPQTGILGWISKTINDILGGFVVGGLTGGNVSEMSVQYNEYLDKYVVLYTDGGNNVVMRVSDSPQGEWSDATVLVANDPLSGNTGMYAPMIHPWSGTEGFGDGDQYLYYNLSYWDEYNVRTMQTDLSLMGPAANSTSGTVAV